MLRAARVLRQLGSDQLSITQSTALSMIEKYEPITISELASLEQVARPTASAVVSRLEELGYVVRLGDPDDGRICRLKITRSGRAHLKVARSRRTDWLVAQLANHTEEELASLHTAIAVLDDIRAGFGSTGGGSSVDARPGARP
ncbi:MarR family winged helix-turn-helix transcriptional regulator [Frankia gtarii]|uniref:MarR family winged helix-turn-helix transcriptional regulator n=1 Tax=Frankia gtarii TaxID=2950102 RepID=UPI0021C0C94F|nr:MarR family transcriptional regulator [Frankia gtarii]